MSKFKQHWQAFRSNETCIFCLGLAIVLTASLIELMRGRAENFVDYSDATRNFWLGISSYTQDYVNAHGRYYIYSPVFNIFFTPFAYLPRIIGGVLWNVTGYCIYVLGLKHLPGTLKNKTAPMLLYLLLFMGQTVFCFQYNLLITCIFVWAYILFEKGHNFWAVLLIMISATTKIYGIVELALLFCYPKFWKNLGYAALTGVCLILLPALRLGFTELMTWYQDWFDMLTYHAENTCVYYSVVWAQPIQAWAQAHMRLIQIGALLIPAVLFVLCHKIWQTEKFKVGVIAVLMMYIVLFSEAAEFTTYTIAVTGYAMWYFLEDKRTVFDRVCFWLVFVLFGVMPIDLLCPPAWNMYVHTHLWLGVWLMVVVWIRMIYTTVLPNGCEKLKIKNV